MKNKVILLLVAVVVLASLALVGCGQVPAAVGFVSPAKTTYYVGDALDLTGGKVYGDEMADVQLTTSMLDATSYNMAVAGDYTVKGSYNDFEFTFNITVNALPTSYGFVAPGQTTYYVGDSLNLAGGKVTVYGDTTQNVDLTAEMLDEKFPSTSFRWKVFSHPCLCRALSPRMVISLSPQQSLFIL